MNRSSLPDWCLPAGVGHSLWEYAQADHIADDYDDYFAYNSLFAFDLAVLERHFAQPGILADLGCGTGRLLVPFAQRGFRCLAVDLSQPMLRVVGQKAVQAGVEIARVQANLVELDCLADASVDYAVIMFSTLGMIRSREHRATVLAHARRILKPGGRFVCHLHNRWYNLFDPQGRWWIARNLLEGCRRGGLEWGDKVYDYRGIPKMYLHLYTEGELRRCLRAAGFELIELLRLDTERQRALKHQWFLPRLRANGWIATCH